MSFLKYQEPDDRPRPTHLVFRAHKLRPMTPFELLRFMHHVRYDDETGCWDWIGRRHRHKYGQFHYNGCSAWAHRLSYTHFIGEIPKDHVVDHICRNKRCVNPEHLKAVTLSQNCQLAYRRIDDRTLCLFDE